MKKNSLAAVTLLAILIALSAGQSLACDFPPKSFFSTPRREFRGPYINRTFGYSVVIPNTLAGYDGSDPATPQHGFGILVGDPPRGYLVIDGEANSLDETAPIDAALRSLQYLRSEGKQIESASIKAAKLGNLRAVQLVVTYSCHGSPNRYTQAATFALSPRKDTLFEVTLYDLEDKYIRDRSTLELILRSWKYVGRGSA